MRVRPAGDALNARPRRVARKSGVIADSSLLPSNRVTEGVFRMIP